MSLVFWILFRWFILRQHSFKDGRICIHFLWICSSTLKHSTLYQCGRFRQAIETMWQAGKRVILAEFWMIHVTLCTLRGKVSPNYVYLQLTQDLSCLEIDVLHKMHLWIITLLAVLLRSRSMLTSLNIFSMFDSVCCELFRTC